MNRDSLTSKPGFRKNINNTVEKKRFSYSVLLLNFFIRVGEQNGV